MEKFCFDINGSKGDVLVRLSGRNWGREGGRWNEERNKIDYIFYMLSKGKPIHIWGISRGKFFQLTNTSAVRKRRENTEWMMVREGGHKKVYKKQQQQQQQRQEKSAEHKGWKIMCTYNHATDSKATLRT